MGSIIIMEEIGMKENRGLIVVNIPDAYLDSNMDDITMVKICSRLDKIMALNTP